MKSQNVSPAPQRLTIADKILIAVLAGINLVIIAGIIYFKYFYQ